MNININKDPTTLELVEFIDADTLNAIGVFIQDVCRGAFEAEGHSEQYAKHYFDNLGEQFNAYKSKEVEGVIPVEYTKPKHGMGRVHPTRALGLTSFSKQIRNAMIKDHYYDFDLSNAQPEIIRNLCVSNNIPCDAITTYCNQRQAIFIELSSVYECSPNKIKKLFLRLCFFGTFEAWARENNVNKLPTLFINEFTENLQQIAQKIKKKNPKLFKLAYDKNKNNAIGSMFALFVQDYELRIVKMVINRLMKETKLTTSRGYSNVITYEYDGIKLLKTNCDESGGVVAVLGIINGYLTDEEWDMKFEQKNIESKINLALYMQNDMVINPPTKENTSEKELEDLKLSFNDFKAEFEHRGNFKIKKSSNYATFIDGELFIKSRESMVHCHEEYCYYEPNKKGKIEEHNFVAKWLKTPTIRKYDDVQIYPPGGQVCPPNHYNMWVPFDAENIKYEHDQEAIDMFLNHLKILCGHDETIYEYTLLWIGQMFQHPGRKPGTMPIFTSKEGAGKGSFMYVLERMIGKARVVETANANDLLGTFNGLVADAFLISVNELSKSQIGKEGGKLKEMITDRKISINAKYQAHRLMNSFHRLIGFTNKGNPIHIEDETRRLYVVRCSDELCFNTAYFNAFYAKMGGNDAIASVFNYFMSIPDIQRFYDMKLPASAYQQELTIMNRALSHQWLEAYVDSDELKTCKEPEISLTNKQLYERFVEWRDSNGFKYETNSNALACELVNAEIPGFKKQLNGKPKKLILDEIRKHFAKLRQKRDEEQAPTGGGCCDDDVNGYDELFKLLEEAKGV